MTQTPVHSFSAEAARTGKTGQPQNVIGMAVSEGDDRGRKYARPQRERQAFTRVDD